LQQQQQQQQHAMPQNQPGQRVMQPQARLCALSVDRECVLPGGTQQPSEQDYAVAE